MQIYEYKSKCYGCGKCSVECPVGAIHMERDSEGFLYPEIDKEKCIRCNKCKVGCIANLVEEKIPEIERVYACTIKDQKILEKSTSGGIFYLLAKSVLKNGGVVYGAAYGELLNVHHIRIDTEEQLHKLQGSKYVQSDITNILVAVQRDINEGRRILFSGTSCQIAAVRLLVGDTDKLLGVEIACMGCPSPLVWERHIASCQDKWGQIDNVEFRDKCSGWNSSSISYMCEEGKKSYRHYVDIYMKGFGEALFYRPSCHRCDFKGKNSFGDIKLGDFWGIQNYDENYKGINGVSAAIIETEKGRKLFESVVENMDIKDFPYKLMLTYNPYFELSRQPSKNRKSFFDSIANSKRNIDELIQEHLYPELSEKEMYWYRYPVVENLLRLSLEEEGVLRFFKKNNYHKVALYGLGDLGNLVLKVLKKEGVEVSYLIDRNYKRFPEYVEGVKVIGLHQVKEADYDCIIVTALLSYSSILELLMLQDVDLDKVISVGCIV